MGSGEPGIDFDEIDVMMPQFHEFPGDEVGLIEHILDNFVDVFAPVPPEDLLLLGRVLAIDVFLLEESELVGVDQDVGVHLLVQLGHHPVVHHAVLLQQALVLLFHAADNDLLDSDSQDHVLALEGEGGGLSEVGLPGLDLLVLLQQPLLFGVAEPAELKELQAAGPEAVVEADGVD